MRNIITAGLLFSMLAGCGGEDEPNSADVEWPASTGTSRDADTPTSAPVTKTPAVVTKDEGSSSEAAPTANVDAVAAKVDAVAVEGNLAPVDLSPYGEFLTVDLPSDAKVSSNTGTIEIEIKDQSISINRINSPVLEQVMDDEADRLRNVTKPSEVIVDEPNRVVSGLSQSGVGAYSCRSKIPIDGTTYTVGVFNVEKRVALLAADFTRTLRRTESNKTAEMKYQRAKAKLEQLGCKYDGIGSHTLELKGEEITDTDVALLSDLPALYWITISAPNVSAGCLDHFRQLGNLHNVQFDSEQIDGSWLGSLRDLSKIDQLVITGATISEDGWESLGALKQLEHLTIRVPVSGGCLKAIGQLPNLTWVEVVNAGIDDAMLADLSLKAEANVYLYLSGNPITDAGLEHLRGFKQLNTLNLKDTKVTAAGIKMLKAALPNCEVVLD